MQLSPGVPAYFKPPLFGFPTAKGAGSWYGGLKWGLEGKPNNGWCARELSPRRLSALPAAFALPRVLCPPPGLAARPQVRPAVWVRLPHRLPRRPSGGLTELDDSHTRYWTYRMEWKLGADAGGVVPRRRVRSSMDAASFGEYRVRGEA